MYLVYSPEGSSEPQKWKYEPNKLLSAEREMLERRTGMDFAKFTASVISGNSACRRALLFMFLKRDHAKVRYEDVDFAWDELDLQYSKQEFALLREKVAETLTGDELTAALAQIDQEIETAYDDGESGKAQLPIAG